MLKKLIKSSNLRCFSSTAGTVDSKEIQQFQKFQEEWWNNYGFVKPLHSMNKLRVPLIRDGLFNTGAIKIEQINKPTPLNNVELLDVGCGGGILSEPLARLGARVTGIDANPEVIDLAKCHSQQHNLKINYAASSIEEHASKNPAKYDAIVASEIIEHVTNKNEFLRACIECLKPSGSIFITTMSKTFLANFAGIILAENVFNLVPKGTHQIDKFILPQKLQRLLEDNGCRTELINGMFYNILTNTWHWCSDTSINYGLHAVKLNNS